MSELDDMQFELLPTTTAQDGQVFGIGAKVSIDDAGFDPGEDDWEVEDEMNPRRGGTAFGRDILAGPTWGFALHVNESDVATAKATLGEFKTAWRALSIRQRPGTVLPLRYQLDQEVRRVYGRPRRFAAPPDNKILSGYIPITADFQCADSFTYDDAEQVQTLQLNVGSEGGFIFPATFPFQTLPTGLNVSSMVVGGDAPTYPVIRITGPVTNPLIETDDWTLTLDMSIALGDYVEIDLRPWAMTALLNGDSSVAGQLGRRQYLADMALQPGPTVVVYRGSGGSGFSTCSIRWRNAWNSI